MQNPLLDRAYWHILGHKEPSFSIPQNDGPETPQDPRGDGSNT